MEVEFLKNLVLTTCLFLIAGVSVASAANTKIKSEGEYCRGSSTVKVYDSNGKPWLVAKKGKTFIKSERYIALGSYLKWKCGNTSERTKVPATANMLRFEYHGNGRIWFKFYRHEDVAIETTQDWCRGAGFIVIYNDNFEIDAKSQQPKGTAWKSFDSIILPKGSSEFRFPLNGDRWRWRCGMKINKNAGVLADKVGKYAGKACKVALTTALSGKGKVLRVVAKKTARKAKKAVCKGVSMGVEELVRGFAGNWERARCAGAKSIDIKYAPDGRITWTCYSKGASAVTSQFTRIKNAAISGQNHKNIKNVSRSQCKTKCKEEGTFVCRSFDYSKKSKSCDLSSATKNTAGGLKTDYSGNPYDHYHRNW